MSYNVVTSKIFEKEAKRLIRKFPSLKKEVLNIIEKLEVDPFLGTSLGHNCYKIRVPIASKRKGKSGGARIISNFVVSKNTVYLLSIYDKSDKVTISDYQIKALIGSLSDGKGLVLS